MHPPRCPSALRLPRHKFWKVSALVFTMRVTLYSDLKKKILYIVTFSHYMWWLLLGKSPHIYYEMTTSMTSKVMYRTFFCYLLWMLLRVVTWKVCTVLLWTRFPGYGTVLCIVLYSTVYSTIYRGGGRVTFENAVFLAAHINLHMVLSIVLKTYITIYSTFENAFFLATVQYYI